MAALAKDTARTYESGVEPVLNDIAVLAGATIYEGAVVEDQAGNGYAKPYDGTGTSGFLGFAFRGVDNLAGSSGDVSVRLVSQGVIKMPVTGASGVTDVSQIVYADADDNTLTLTDTDNMPIGKVHRWISGTECMVFFQSDALASR